MNPHSSNEAQTLPANAMSESVQQGDHRGAAVLARRCVDMAQVRITSSLGEGALVRGGRKGQPRESPVQAAAGAGAYDRG